MKLLFAASACAALAITCYLLGRDEFRAADAPSTVSASQAAVQRVPSPRSEPGEPLTSLVVDSEPRSLASAPAIDRIRVRGRVVDVSGKAITGGRIETVPFEARTHGSAEPEPCRVTADASGSFEVDVDGPCSLWWVGDDKDRRTIVEALFHSREAAAHEYEIVVAPHIHVRGRVEDETGRPVTWMRVRWRAADGWLSGLTKNDSRRQRWRVRDASAETVLDGKFDLEVPAIEGSTIELCDEDAVIETRSLPNQVALDMRFVVQSETVEGFLVRPDGSPVIGAELDSGNTTRTDGHGRFEFPPAPKWTAERSLRICERVGPCLRFVNFGARWISRDRSRPFEIVFDGLPGVIRGTVLNSDGSPAEGWRVDVSKRPAVDESGVNHFVPAFPCGARTDARGHFEIAHASPGLSELYVRSPDDLIGFHASEVRANDPAVVIRVPGDAVVPVLRGRIVSTHGDPIPNARIAFDVAGFDECIIHVGRTSATSDADGRFETRDVSRAATRVSVISLDERYLPYDGIPLELEPGDRTTIRVSLAARARFERRRFDVEGDRIVFLDVHGKPVLCRKFADPSVNTGSVTYESIWTCFPIEDDRSTMLVLSDDAAYVAVHGPKGEVARMPVALATGRENVVIWR